MKKIVFYILACLVWCVPIFGNSFLNVHADIATFLWNYSEDLQYVSCHVTNSQNIKCKKSHKDWGKYFDQIEDIEIPKFQWKKYLWLEEWGWYQNDYRWLCGIRSTWRIDCIGALEWFETPYNSVASAHGMIKSISFSKGSLSSCGTFNDGHMICVSGWWGWVTTNNIPDLPEGRTWDSVVVYSNDFACGIDSTSEIHCFWKMMNNSDLQKLKNYSAKRLIPYKFENAHNYRIGYYSMNFCFINTDDGVNCLDYNNFNLNYENNNLSFIDFYLWASSPSYFCGITTERFLTCAWDIKAGKISTSAKEILYIDNFFNSKPYAVFVNTLNYIDFKNAYMPTIDEPRHRHEIYEIEESRKVFHPQFTYVVASQQVCENYDVNDYTQLSYDSVNTPYSWNDLDKSQLFSEFNSGHFSIGPNFNFNNLDFFSDYHTIGGISQYDTWLVFNIKSSLFSWDYVELFSYKLHNRDINNLVDFWVLWFSDDHFKVAIKWANDEFIFLNSRHDKDYNLFSFFSPYNKKDIFRWLNDYDKDFKRLYFLVKPWKIFDTSYTITGVYFEYSEIKKPVNMCIYYDISDEEYEYIDIDEDGKVTYDDGEVSGEVKFDGSTNTYCVWNSNNWCIKNIETEKTYSQDGKKITQVEYENTTWTWWSWWEWWSWWDNGWFWLWRPDEWTIYNKVIWNGTNTLKSVWNLLSISLPVSPQLNGKIPIPTLTEDFKIWLISSSFELQPPRDVLNVSDIDELDNITSKKFLTFLLGLLYIGCRIVLIWIVLFWIFLFWKCVDLFFSTFFWDTLNTRWWLSNVWWVVVYAVVIAIVLTFVSWFLYILNPATTFLNDILKYLNLFFTYTTSTLSSYSFFVGMINGFFMVFAWLMWPLLTWRLYMKFWRLGAW